MQTKLVQISEKAKMIIFKNTKQDVEYMLKRSGNICILPTYIILYKSANIPWGTSTHTNKFHKNLIINSYIARI